MAVTSPSPMRTVREPQWTPRQREVLDLLVRGNTNSEIAQRLGISLDGAKWHVSEIITRLGVDSRDEAAEYWRHHNGLRMRFSRVMAGLFSSGALKWGTATVFIGGVVVVSAMVIVAMRENAGDQSEPTAGNPPSDTPADVTPPANQPTAVATPPPTGETIAGVPVGAISFTKPGSFPVPMSAIIEKGCWQCDASPAGFERVSTAPDGRLVVEEVFKAPRGYITGSYWDPAGREHYVTICTRGICGPMGQPTADAQTTVFASKDGGVTWQEAETVDGYAYVSATSTRGPVLNRSTFDNGVSDYKFQVLGTSDFIRPPAGATPEFSGDRLVGWRLGDGVTIQGLDGSTLLRLPDLSSRAQSDYPVQVVDVRPNGDALLSWHQGGGAIPYATYIGVVRGGQITAVYKGPGAMGIQRRLNDSAAYGNVVLMNPDGTESGGPFYPALFDLTNGSVHVLELYGPVGASDYGGRNFVRTVQPGPFLRVTGAGDCLNVREQAATSAKSLGCFADNVLLKDLAAEEQSGGVTWKKVATPGGQEGWASAEFLR